MSVIKDVDERKEKVEALADYAHEAWSGWMKYMFKKCFLMSTGAVKIPAEYAKQLSRLMKTEYKDLTIQEQESDREEARKMLEIMGDGV